MNKSTQSKHTVPQCSSIIVINKLGDLRYNKRKISKQHYLQLIKKIKLIDKTKFGEHKNELDDEANIEEETESLDEKADIQGEENDIQDKETIEGEEGSFSDDKGDLSDNGDFEDREADIEDGETDIYDQKTSFKNRETIICTTDEKFNRGGTHFKKSHPGLTVDSEQIDCGEDTDVDDEGNNCQDKLGYDERYETEVYQNQANDQDCEISEASDSDFELETDFSDELESDKEVVPENDELYEESECDLDEEDELDEGEQDELDAEAEQDELDEEAELDQENKAVEENEHNEENDSDEGTECYEKDDLKEELNSDIDSDFGQHFGKEIQFHQEADVDICKAISPEIELKSNAEIQSASPTSHKHQALTPKSRLHLKRENAKKRKDPNFVDSDVVVLLSDDEYSLGRKGYRQEKYSRQKEKPPGNYKQDATMNSSNFLKEVKQIEFQRGNYKDRIYHNVTKTHEYNKLDPKEIIIRESNEQVQPKNEHHLKMELHPDRLPKGKLLRDRELQTKDVDSKEFKSKDLKSMEVKSKDLKSNEQIQCSLDITNHEHQRLSPPSRAHLIRKYAKKKKDPNFIESDFEIMLSEEEYVTSEDMDDPEEKYSQSNSRTSMKNDLKKSNRTLNNAVSVFKQSGKSRKWFDAYVPPAIGLNNEGSKFSVVDYISPRKTYGNLSVNNSDKDQEKKLKCLKCEKTFASTRGLQQHEQSIHLKVRYPCKDCDKSFSSKTSLTKHQRLHTGNMIECQLCDKSFLSEHGFDYHMLTHEKLKVFECIVCEKEFYTNAKLQRHFKTTLHERLCGQWDEFKNKYNLQDDPDGTVDLRRVQNADVLRK